MESVLLAIAGVSALVWLGLLFGRSGFWRADQRLGHPPEPRHLPAVAAIVPARNEAATIAAATESLRAQTYGGRLRVIVVDDSSDDDTAARARDAGAEVIAAPPLERGWSGKLWALNTGIEAIGGEAVDFLWFTDADIVHPADTLARLVAKAQAESRDLVSLMVRLRCEGAWERLIVPAFVFFFQMLYPFPAINAGNGRTAGAAGGCMLVRRSAFEAAGGFAAMKDALIDDCTLAARIRKAGGRLWLGLAEGSRSLRRYESLAPLWAMIKRTAFTQLGYSWLLLGITVLGLALTFLAPPVILALAIVTADPTLGLPAAVGWLLMAVAYRPTLAYYGRPAAEALILPFVAVLYTAMTLDSAISHWRGHGSRWKGRDYSESDARERSNRTE